MVCAVQRKLEEQRAKLERLHELERAASEKQATSQERARIMQDMHDGLGSQLISSLAMAQGGTLSADQTYELLRSCIDDLRLAIDTSNDTKDSLPLALANLPLSDGAEAESGWYRAALEHKCAPR
jgi:signal transduction histidine kinase